MFEEWMEVKNKQTDKDQLSRALQYVIIVTHTVSYITLSNPGTEPSVPDSATTSGVSVT